MSEKVVLIDGNSIAYRAFFALPLLNNEKGIHTNAIYGFTMMLLKILEEEKPTHLLVAFDAGKTTFRHGTFAEYKGGRQKTPSELSEQFPFIREVLNAFNVKTYQLENYEADDIIGTISRVADEKEMEVKVISGDRDLLQLVSPHVSVGITRKGITDVDVYTPDMIQEKYELTPTQIIDMKGLMGDQSDNIPGVPGVGEKTAIKLLKEYGTVEDVLGNIEHISGKKLKERLEENKDLALISKQLATIERQSPITITIEDLMVQEMNDEKVISLFKDLGFNTLLEKMGKSVQEESVLQDVEVTIVTEVTKELLTSSAAIMVEVLEENYHTGEIVGFSLVNEHGQYFIPATLGLQSPLFVQWLEDETMAKATYNAKQAYVSLKWQGITLRGVEFDLFLASYLLDPSEGNKDFATVAKSAGYVGVSNDEAIYGKGAKVTLPSEEILAEHIVRKALAVYEVKENITKQLRENEQEELFHSLELPLSMILGEMEYGGVKVDVNRLQEMGQELSGRLKEIEGEIFRLAGEEFNVNSPKQLGVILFDKLGLPPVKKTKTGYSTSAEVLEKLADSHEIVESILMYRQLGKLYSTYVEGLLKVVHEETSRIHTRFNQALTATGRLSSTEPNLQNIPIRLEEGRKIRQAFIPSQEGWEIFAADYSQIELRVLAHISKDDNLIQAFKEGQDIHTKTASEVFHVSPEEVTSLMRRQAKAVNFGIVYGISDYGLSQSLNISRKEAAAFIERYLHTFEGVKGYMHDVVREAKMVGYVETLLHRRRYIPELTSSNFNLRSFAERTAMNTPIQGTAADIIKKAMIDMASALKEQKMEARLLLQVHDELIFEAPPEEIEKLKELVPAVMEQTIDLFVPLKADYAYGPTWYDAK